MPYLEPMSLSNDDYYALTAWMLNRNDIIAADTVINKESLPNVEMPNRDGFVNAYPDIPGEYDYVE
jgi:cytochrome c